MRKRIKYRILFPKMNHQIFKELSKHLFVFFNKHYLNSYIEKSIFTYCEMYCNKPKFDTKSSLLLIFFYKKYFTHKFNPLTAPEQQKEYSTHHSALPLWANTVVASEKMHLLVVSATSLGGVLPCRVQWIECTNPKSRLHYISNHPCHRVQSD